MSQIAPNTYYCSKHNDFILCFCAHQEMKGLQKQAQKKSYKLNAEKKNSNIFWISRHSYTCIHCIYLRSLHTATPVQVNYPPGTCTACNSYLYGCNSHHFLNLSHPSAYKIYAPDLPTIQPVLLQIPPLAKLSGRAPLARLCCAVCTTEWFAMSCSLRVARGGK